MKINKKYNLKNEVFGPIYNKRVLKIKENLNKENLFLKRISSRQPHRRTVDTFIDPYFNSFFNCYLLHHYVTIDRPKRWSVNGPTVRRWPSFVHTWNLLKIKYWGYILLTPTVCQDGLSMRRRTVIPFIAPHLVRIPRYFLSSINL